MTLMTQNSLPGFADPVHDAQRTFRAILTAMSRPTLPQHLAVVREESLRVPAPLGASVGAVLLALCDEHTPIWLDPALLVTDDVTSWLRFHTGAPLTAEVGEAAYVVVTTPEEVPALSELAQGTDEEPHLSATLVIDATHVLPTEDLVASGPGVDGEVRWDGAGLPSGFLTEWRAERAQFPRGVDVILPAGISVRALPRTTELAVVESRNQIGDGA